MAHIVAPGRGAVAGLAGAARGRRTATIPTGCRVHPPNGSAKRRERTTVRGRSATRSRGYQLGRADETGAAPPIGGVPRAAGGDTPVPTTGDEMIGINETDRADAARSARRDAELNRLAELASGGDRRALELLLGHIRPMVVQYCRARIGAGMLGSQSAEDVAQDVLLAVCGALERWRPEKRVMAFVYGIASNKVVDAYRAAGRDRSVPTDVVPDEPDVEHGPEQAALHGGVVAELRALLEQL